MKTYSESQNRKPFDWKKFLSNSNITENQWGDAKLLARSWVTCACGNQCDIIPRDTDGSPKDEMLSELGGDQGFFKCIKEQDAKGALAILHLIETRSADLIAEERDKIRQKVQEGLERIEDERMRARTTYELALQHLKEEEESLKAKLAL